jgi:anti-sigma regulatory factor (Ser/Thr protein kinase)
MSLPSIIEHDVDVAACCLGSLQRFDLTSVHRRELTGIWSQLPPTGAVLLLANNLSLVPVLAERTAANFVRMGLCDTQQAKRLAVAVEEALVNAIVHGNLEVSSKLRELPNYAYECAIASRQQDPAYSGRRVEFTFCLGPRSGHVTVRDDGPGFDPATVPDPRLPGNLHRPSGRGLLLMRAFVDDVLYRDGGRSVTLVKLAPQFLSHSTGDTVEM